MRISTLFLFILCISSVQVQAQIPANPIGSNPLRLKWEQINTDKVQIIFPEGNETDAQRAANITHYLWDHHNASIGDKMNKITILMQNQPVVPNGFVTVGPFRSEFNLIDPQFNISTDWIDQLTIHEYQHVKQFGNSRRGLTQVARTIFGSWAWGGFAGLALPRWFFEGDAVVQETALTRSGRGRLPAFTMEQRSLILDGINYGYEKAGAGSMQDFVPDWYSLGYFMVGYGRTKYGERLWRGVEEDAVRYKGLFFPFSKSLKKQTGLNTKALYQEMYSDLTEQWSESGSRSTANTILPVNRQSKKTVTHYSNPRWLNNEDLVVEKRGYNLLPMYYRLSSNGTEEKLTHSGILFSAPETTLSEGGNRLVWAEIGFDIRRANRTFSVIRSYNLNTDKRYTLSQASRYFSPAITQQGDRIVAVEMPENGTCRLVILDAANGALIQEIPNPEAYFFQLPRWTPDGSAIIAVGQKNETQALFEISPASGSVTALTPATSDQVSHPDPANDWVYFAAGYTGVNQIYAVSRTGGAIYQITDDPIGAFQPAISPDGTMLAYSAFRTNGFDVFKLPLDPKSWKVFSIPAPADQLPTYAEILAHQEGGTIINNLPNETFPVKKFNKLSGLINFHSWLPQLDPPEVGVSILSDNKLGTLSIDAGAYYNLNEDQWSFNSNLRYAELFPVITLGYGRLNRAARFLNYQPVGDSTIRAASYVEEWTEDKITAGVEIPLNFTKGNAIHRLDLITRFDRFHVNPMGNLDNPDKYIDTLIKVTPQDISALQDLFLDPLAETDLNAIDLRVRWRWYRRQALQHMAPHWGFTTDTRFRALLGGGPFTGYNFVTRGDFFFPGFTRNHGFFVNLGYQRMDELDNYRFSNFFIYPRGYGAFSANEAARLGLNYTLPLAYPDLAIGPLAFIKRIKLNAFADYGILEFDQDQVFRSYGAELRFDVRFLRLLEVDLGVRYSYLQDKAYAPHGQQHQFDFLLISISE